jgi:hypothetical protein
MRAAAADDALVAALAQIAPDVREALTAMTAVTAPARRRLGLPADPEGDAGAPTGVPGRRTGRRPRRSGLGQGFRGIRQQ